YMTSDFAAAGESYAAARAAISATSEVSDAERRLVLAKIAANELAFSNEPMGALMTEVEQIQARPASDDGYADRAVLAVVALALSLGGTGGGAELAKRAVGSFPEGGADDPISYVVSGAL